MRVIGFLEHPTLKITVFETDTRLPIQFEDGHLAQVYRLRKGPGLERLDDVKKLIDASFCTSVLAHFKLMATSEAAAWARISSPDQKMEWPDIV